MRIRWSRTPVRTTHAPKWCDLALYHTIAELDVDQRMLTTEVFSSDELVLFYRDVRLMA